MPFIIYLIIGFGIAILRKYIDKYDPDRTRANVLEDFLGGHMKKTYIEPFIIIFLTILWLPLILFVIVRKIF